MSYCFGIIARKKEFPIDPFFQKMTLGVNNTKQLPAVNELKTTNAIIATSANFLGKVTTCINKIKTLLFEGKIYNRSELISKLSLTTYKDITDAEIFEKLYDKYGEDSYKYIEGDWICCIINEHNEISFTRDKTGTSCLYYFVDENYVAFSTFLKPIAALKKEDTQINIQSTIAFLHTLHYYKNESIIKDVKILDYGSVLKISPNKQTLSKYWNLLETPAVRYKNKRDYYENFFDLYQTAINQRISKSNKTGLLLSSGLDSGSIAAIAANHLKNHNKKLHSFTYVPAKLSHISKNGNEQELAQKQIDFTGNISPNFYQPKLSPVKVLTKLLELDIPPYNRMNSMNWVFGILNEIKNNNVEDLLMGTGGNWTVSWSDKIHHPLSYIGFKRSIKNLITTAPTPNQSNKQSYVKKDLFNQYKMDEYFQELGCNQNLQFEKGINEKMMFLDPEYGKIGVAWKNMGSLFGLNITDPTMDSRIMQFCFNIPEDISNNITGNRLLIRKNFKNLIPKKTLKSQTRGVLGSDAPFWVAQDIDLLYSYFEDIQKVLEVNEILDINKIKDALDYIKKGGNLGSWNTNSLLKAIYTGMYIKKLVFNTSPKF